MLLEGVKEGLENFVLSLLATLDIWVHLCVVALSDVIDIELSTSIFVHDLKCFLGKGSSLWIHLTSNCSQELVIVDMST
jgi:hypothetical protein